MNNNEFFTRTARTAIDDEIERTKIESIRRYHKEVKAFYSTRQRERDDNKAYVRALQTTGRGVTSAWDYPSADYEK